MQEVVSLSVVRPNIKLAHSIFVLLPAAYSFNQSDGSFSADRGIGIQISEAVNRQMHEVQDRGQGKLERAGCQICVSAPTVRQTTG
jgi:hypothetical protein